MTSKARRLALIVASSHFTDQTLQQLVAPGQDAASLARVLEDATVGGFEVKRLINRPSHEVRREIEAFFANRKRDDLRDPPLWEAIAAFDWPVGAVPRPALERTMWVATPDGLKFRSRPVVEDGSWIDGLVFPQDTQLTATGGLTATDAQGYLWQPVRAPDGREGWVVYSVGDEIYLDTRPPELRGLPPEGPETTVWVIASAGLKFRRQPSTDDAYWIDGIVFPAGTRLTAIGSPTPLYGSGCWWRYVRTEEGQEGWVAYSEGSEVYISDREPGGFEEEEPSDTREPVTQPVSGESAYIFGFHDPFDRGLFTGSGKTGWVLFAEEMGADPDSTGGNRAQYHEWSQAGFGVIARLNHGFGSRGTIPRSPLYEQFAAACGRWVEHSIGPNNPLHGCHIWIVGNEMNNPREWPGNQNGVGGERIEPQGYADCFNQVRAAIKAVQPHAIVCPGAVDPYFGPGSDCGQWFRDMLSHIVGLDGIALHTYTHGANPDLITSEDTFGDHPLTWQYFNFYAYRTFMDMIPDRWHHVPVFITETDQDEPWADVNSGWVQRAYEEIHRWNQTAHHQQIRCLLLYRWPRLADDQWWIVGKRGVIEDFQAALSNDYRWRS